MPNFPYVVKYKHFAGGGSLDSLFAQAAEFASRIGPDRVMNISHSEDAKVGVVAVWYRSEPDGVDDHKPTP
jgi:ABC-type nitrate/sulfonate/bicarbonate transport system substrate-binding protein